MAQQQPTGSWSAETGNSYFYYGGAAADGTYMYVFGGYQYGYQYCWRYDPVNNSWAQMAYMPLPCYYNGGAYYNGVVYSFGNAYYGNGNIYAYTISSNTWSTLSANLTGNRYYARAATLGNRIYATGGYYNGYSNLCDEFNPANGSITARANMPGGTYIHAMASVESIGKTYALGGYNNGYLSVCYEYTPPDASSANGTWATRAPISDGASQQPRYGGAAFSLNNRIYLPGGYNNNYMQTTLEYNPISNTWAQRANMTYQRYLHGAVAIGTKGYCYGGIPTYTTGEEFTPPDFGLPPNPPAGVNQAGSRAETALQAKADVSQFDGWTDANISFSANVTDPNASQQVRLRVRVKRTTVSAWTNLDTGLQAQGNLTLNFPIPSDGAYDWEWRVEDSYANAYPTVSGIPGWEKAFGNDTSPDFRSDQVPPSVPIPKMPGNVDIQSPTAGSGDIVLFWEEATDNGPVAGISYEIQVAKEAGFTDIEAQLFSTAGNDQYPVTLSVSRFPKFWRLRARDVGGNLSAWSPSLTFRVTFNDGANHSEGDAKRVCGASAGAAASLSGALFGLAILAMAARRRVFRK
jgi:MYXO-CTERM domain-containing protein